MHQLYGVFPELVGEWKTVTAPGCLAVLRAGLPPQRIVDLTKRDFIRVVQAIARRAYQAIRRQGGDPAAHRPRQTFGGRYPSAADRVREGLGDCAFASHPTLRLLDKIS